MPMQPLTHHEILGLVGPFTRRGHLVDLAASDRLARRLAFRPLVLPGTDGRDLVQTLRLDCLGTGSFALTRCVTSADGLQASLSALGPDPGALLAHIDAVPPDRQFAVGPGYALALGHALEGLADASASQPPQLLLRAGVAQIDGLRLTLTLSPVRGVAADLQLADAAGARLDLPDDLLAVLGWDWSHLLPADAGWSGKLRLRGAPARRSQGAEAGLHRAAAHLAQLLAAPPAQFHARWRLARWGVVLRRSIPSLTAIGLIAGALALPRLTDGRHAGLWMALHYVPIALLALSFSLQERARFEIPRWPRRSAAPGWRRAGPAGQTASGGPASGRPVIDLGQSEAGNGR